MNHFQPKKGLLIGGKFSFPKKGENLKKPVPLPPTKKFPSKEVF